VANHQQAEKRNRQRVKRQAEHRHERTSMRTLVKRVTTAVEEKNPEQAKQALKLALPMLDKCGRKGVIPKQRASRTVSRLTRAVNALTP
jgi:small subunit ribosomal protein S20